MSQLPTCAIRSVPSSSDGIDGVGAELPGGNLIDGRPRFVVAALGALRASAAEERGVGRGMVAGGVRVPQLEVREHRQVIEIGRQRGERRRERGDAPLTRRRPRHRIHPHRDVDESQPAHRVGRRLGHRGQRRHHRVQQRQRHRHTQPSQEGPARQGHLADDHFDLLHARPEGRAYRLPNLFHPDPRSGHTLPISFTPDVEVGPTTSSPRPQRRPLAVGPRFSSGDLIHGKRFIPRRVNSPRTAGRSISSSETARC